MAPAIAYPFTHGRPAAAQPLRFSGGTPAAGLARQPFRQPGMLRVRPSRMPGILPQASSVGRAPRRAAAPPRRRAARGGNRGMPGTDTASVIPARGGGPRRPDYARLTRPAAYAPRPPRKRRGGQRPKIDRRGAPRLPSPAGSSPAVQPAASARNPRKSSTPLQKQGQPRVAGCGYWESSRAARLCGRTFVMPAPSRFDTARIKQASHLATIRHLPRSLPGFVHVLQQRHHDALRLCYLL